MTYAEKLKDPRWQRKRLQILERDNFKCTGCTDDKSTLHVHHYKYSKTGNPWDAQDDDLSTLCEYCHALVEHQKKRLPHVDFLQWAKINNCYGTVDFIVMCYDREGKQLYFSLFEYDEKEIKFLLFLSESTLSCLNFMFNKWNYLEYEKPIHKESNG